MISPPGKEIHVETVKELFYGQNSHEKRFLKSLQPWFKLWHRAKDTHSGKLSLNMEREAKLKWEEYLKSLSTKFVFNLKFFQSFSNHGLSLWRQEVECDVDCCLAADIISNRRQMNGRKLRQLCTGSSGTCNKRLTARTHLWSSCWHTALLYTILLNGELSSGTCGVVWILHLQNLPRHTTHSQRKLGRLSFIHGVQVRVQRFYVGVPSDGRNFISAISKLIQLSDKSFAGHMACHSFVTFFNRCSLDNGLHDLAYLSLTHSLRFIPNVGLWLLVDGKIQWTAFF